jgi:transcriptional regulator with XRE-family HTH domain
MEKKWLKMKSPEFRHAVVEAEIVNEIAAQIRTIRQQRGWSQKKLADLLDTTQAAISRLEDPSYGRYSVQTLLAIGRAFDVAMHFKFVPFTQFLVETTCSAKRECLEADSFETEDINIQYYVSHINTTKIANITTPSNLQAAILKKQFNSHLQGSTAIASAIQSRAMDFFISQKGPCMNEYGYETE